MSRALLHGRKGQLKRTTSTLPCIRKSSRSLPLLEKRCQMRGESRPYFFNVPLMRSPHLSVSSTVLAERWCSMHRCNASHPIKTMNRSALRNSGLECRKDLVPSVLLPYSPEHQVFFWNKREVTCCGEMFLAYQRQHNKGLVAAELSTLL